MFHILTKANPLSSHPVCAGFTGAFTVLSAPVTPRQGASPKSLNHYTCVLMAHLLTPETESGSTNNSSGGAGLHDRTGVIRRQQLLNMFSCKPSSKRMSSNQQVWNTLGRGGEREMNCGKNMSTEVRLGSEFRS